MSGVDAVSALDLGRRYGDKWGLRYANFKIPRGKISMLIGPNGAGKTTTVKLLATILKPSEGSAEVLGYDINDGYRAIRPLISYMPQEASIDNNWTPFEAVKWYLVSRGYSPSTASSHAREWLTRLGLEDYRGVSGWRLSGGNKRKVLLAMTLAPETELIFLDEPTVGLDVETKYVVWGVLKEVVREGRTILLTTHDMREGERLSEYLVFLSEGRVTYNGYLSEVISRFPYKYRILLEGSMEVDGYPCIEVGGERIIYLKRVEEARLLLEANGAWDSMKVERTGLEDIYLSLARGGVNGEDI